MLEEAQANISRAQGQQKIGNLEGAFDNYQLALSGLLELYRNEADATRKVELGELIEVTTHKRNPFIKTKAI